MPLTFAHPAAVLPLLPALRRLRIDPTCLVIGAMAPDVEYFIHGRMHGGNGHTFTGLLTWSLPVTVIVALLFHAVVKWPLLLVLPERVARRMVPELAPHWPPRPAKPSVAVFWLLAAASAVVGATTHLIWDGFAHTEGFIVVRVPALLAPVHLPLIGKTIPLCRVLQHVSTALGMLIVAAWLWRRRWPAARPLPPVSRAFARAFAAFAIAVALVISYAHLWLWFRWGANLDDGVAATISGMLGGAIVAACVLWSRAQEWRSAVVHDLD